MFSSSLFAAALIALAGIASAEGHKVNVNRLLAVSSPETVPVGASQVVPHDFASFSFPAHWFADFCGEASTSHFDNGRGKKS